MHIRRITPTIGGEITGIDLTQPVADSDVAAIEEAWLAGKVAVFPAKI